MRRATKVLIVGLVWLPFACEKSDGSVRLLQAGKSRHAIVIEPDASPSERHAAEELRSHFEACSGVDLPVLESVPADGGPMIVLGCGPHARALGVDPPSSELGLQGARIRTVPPHLVIAGAREAGTLYGVHRFLEDALGVRWYAPGVTRTPEVDELVVPACDRLSKPAFFWRHTSWTWPGHDDDFMARVGDNYGSSGADNPQGIQFDRGGSAHSYLHYVPVREFFDTHPEYFSEIGGQRISEDTQLCLSNPDVLEIVAERMLAEMEAEPNRWQFTFSQMDRYNACECDRCRAINEQYGTQGGTQFYFVNQLAERCAAEFPDKLVRTLAYMYTEEPPRGMRMHPNVAIWLCHMFPSCDSHPVQTCPLNADFKRRAEAWAQLTDHLFVWHYYTDFMHYYCPFPNMHATAESLRFYRDIGVDGVYLQAMGHSGGGGEFSLLKPYFGMQMLWDPDQEPDTVIQDFLDGYYGQAAGPIFEYISSLHRKVEDESIHMHLYTNPGQGYLPDEIVLAGEALFDQAEQAVADDAELLERVRVARMPLVYARFFPRNGYELTADGKLHWLGARATFAELMDFIERMEAHGFQTVREVSGEPDTLLMLWAMLGADLDVVAIENPALRVEIVPMLAGRALRIVDRGSGECVTAYNVKTNLYFPFAGGLEDRVGDGFEFYGWVEPTSVAERSARSVSLVSTTLDGFGLRRTLELDPELPVLRVRTELTNDSDDSRTTRLRSHLELDLGDLAATRVRFASRGGTQVDEDMSRVIEGMRQGVHFYDQDTPQGGWTLSGSKGLELVQRFDDAAVDSAWLYAYPASAGELEIELWSPRTEIAPGGSLAIAQEIELRAL